MKNNEIHYLKISPINLAFKNNSIQASLSKEFSLIKSKDYKSNSIKKNETQNNISNFNNINNYFNNHNSSSSSAREQSFEYLKEKVFSAGFRTNLKHRLPTKKKTSFQTLKYRPKRLINFSNLKSYPQNKILYSKGLLGYEKLPLKNLKIDKSNNPKSTNNLLGSPKNKINLDFIKKENTINNKNVINFKTNQIKIFSKTSSNYNNLKKYLSFTSERTKVRLDSFFSQLVNNVEIQRNTLFIDNDNYNYFTSSSIDTCNNNNGINSNNNNDNNNGINTGVIDYNKYLFNNKVMFKFLNINSEYNFLINKCFELIFNELKEIKIKNMELQKENYETEILLSMKNKEIKEIDKYLNSSQTQALIHNNKTKEKIVKDLNIKFNKKENKYLLNIYKLNDEMKDLLFLLDKNKEYYNKCKDLEKKQKLNMYEVKNIRNHLTSELDKKNAQYINEKEVNEELNDQIYKLEETINELKSENDSIKLHEIEITSQVKKLYMIINERNENINMLNEELNYYYIKLNKEIKEHEKTKSLLRQFKNKYEIKKPF